MNWKCFSPLSFVLLILVIGPLSTEPASAAGDWLSRQRAAPYRGLSAEQLERLRHAQILRFLQEQERHRVQSSQPAKMPVPDSRFPESYRALADYYREQAQQKHDGSP